jgi:peptidoglycan/LPS O-acetylase OafA/YrhL
MDKIKWFSVVRVFGVFLILGYHLFYEFLPGGFLGVDIFFTFSGFLITAIIIEEVRKKGGFMLFKFYTRRTRRILIPLFISIALTLPFALLISRDFTVGIGKQIAAALSFTSNWHNIIVGTSYEAQLLPSMYIHMWSLAVEMQFYIAWGFVCALIAAIAETV